MDTQDYIIDYSFFDETSRAVGLPVCRRSESYPVSTIWFPKDYVKVHISSSYKVRVTVPKWLIKKKRESGELLPGFDILTTF